MSHSVPFDVARQHFELGSDDEGHSCRGDHHNHSSLHTPQHSHDGNDDDRHQHHHPHHPRQDDDGLRKRPHHHHSGHDHDHDHGGCGHDHSHDGWRKYLPHSHGLETRLHSDARSLSIALFILISACTAQLVGGIFAKSSVLRVEALHSALDGVTVVISLVSVLVAARPPTPRYSYGFGRAEVLSALISILALVLLCVKLFVEAAQRLGHILRGTKAPIHVQGSIVFLAEAITLSCNVFMAVVLTGGNSSLNIRALRAHVIADSVENLVVLFAGFLMWCLPKLSVLDPILTLVIVVLIVVLNVGIAKESVNVLLQGAPMGVKVETDVVKRVAKVEGVREVGVTHVWTVTSGSYVGSAVVFVEPGGVRFEEVERIQRDVAKVFEDVGVAEVTVQVRRAAAANESVEEISSDDVAEGEEYEVGYSPVATMEQLV